MTDEKFTPGPWEARANAYGCWFVYGAKPRPLAVPPLVCGGNSHDTLTEHNARLMAAAPAMYALLSNCRDAIASLDEGDLGYGEPGDGSRYPIRDDGVPLEMGRAVARAVKAAIAQERAP